MQDFKKLLVWQKAMAATRTCYEATERFPPSQRFGLRSQMQRAAVSIPSNIAEGSGRRTNPEFARFLRIAYGSSCELETQARLAIDLGFGWPDALEVLIRDVDEIQRMLSRLIDRVEESVARTRGS